MWNPETQIIIAPSEDKPQYQHRIFLAGGITGCPDWQSEFIRRFGNAPLTMFNPRRPNWDMKDPTCSAEVQIEWEYKRFQEATMLIFWFPKETLCPIVLFELGAYLKTSKALWIGVHPEYQRRIDVEIQSKLFRPTRDMHYNITDLIKKVGAYVHFNLGLT